MASGQDTNRPAIEAAQSLDEIKLMLAAWMDSVEARLKKAGV